VKERRVVLAPEAADDLNEIYDWVALPASPDVALRYIERLEAFCRRLSGGGERGRVRSDIRPGLRVIGFERRVSVAFSVDEEVVTVLRLFRAGRDWEASFDP
jgi:toxin ParE1/3/4